MLEMLDFTSADPPNAAILTRTGDGEDILVVELFNPALDEASATLTYEARILAGNSGDHLGDSTWDCFPCEGAPGNDGTNLQQCWSDKCNAHVAACNNQCSSGVYGG